MTYLYIADTANHKKEATATNTMKMDPLVTYISDHEKLKA